MQRVRAAGCTGTARRWLWGRTVGRMAEGGMAGGDGGGEYWGGARQ